MSGPNAADAALYAELGVSTSKSQVHAAVAELGAGLLRQGFCRVHPSPFGGEDVASVLHSDATGTKPQVAYIAWRESGDLAHFAGLAQDAVAMNTDDMLCVGCTGPFLLTNTIARNSYRVGGQVLKALIDGYRSHIAQLDGQGVQIVHCGGEVEDVPAAVGTLTVGCSLHAEMPRAGLIDAADIQPGDQILSLALPPRQGEARRGAEIGCNGLTLARHALLWEGYARRYPECFSPQAPPPLPGGLRMEDPLDGPGGPSLAQELLAPTRSYAPFLAPLLRQGRPAEIGISALVHNTGGGQTKCLGFGSGLCYNKRLTDEPAPLYLRIMERAGVEPQEMYQVFNMGRRMELYCRAEAAGPLLDQLAATGLDAALAGEVQAGKGGANRLRLETPLGTLEYGA